MKILRYKINLNCIAKTWFWIFLNSPFNLIAVYDKKMIYHSHGQEQFVCGTDKQLYHRQL